MSVMEVAAPPTVEPVDLHRGDVGLVYGLYMASLAEVPDPSAVRADEPSFFEWVFDVGGEIVGLTHGGELVAYGVLRPELPSEHDRVGLDARVPAGAALRVLDGSAVHPDHWRHGLQRTVIDLRIARAASEGASHVIAKASPGNVPSMRNLTRSGFHIVGLVKKPYGWRYVHHRPVGAPPPAAVEDGWAPAADVDASRRRFAAGEVAVAARRDEAGAPVLQWGRAVG